MALVKGPFTVKWGEDDDATIVDVSEITFNYEVATNDYQTVDGRTYQVEGAITASVEITVLKNDVEALKALLPQYYVAPNAPLSTGEIAGADGAIDIVAASCDSDATRRNLEISSCGADGETTRLVNARPTLSSQEFADNAVRTVTITFIGEPDQNQGIVQFFKNGSLTPVES